MLKNPSDQKRTLTYGKSAGLSVKGWTVNALNSAGHTQSVVHSLCFSFTTV